MCPNEPCRNASARQRGLTADEIERLGRPDWGHRAQTCMECGRLYSFEESGEVKIRGEKSAGSE